MPIYSKNTIKYYAHNYLCLTAAVNASTTYPGMPVCIKINSNKEAYEAQRLIDEKIIRPRRLYMTNRTINLMLDYETTPPKVYRLMGPPEQEIVEEIK